MYLNVVKRDTVTTPQFKKDIIKVLIGPVHIVSRATVFGYYGHLNSAKIRNI